MGSIELTKRHKTSIEIDADILKEIDKIIAILEILL
jgi:hypothetical protein